MREYFFYLIFAQHHGNWPSLFDARVVFLIITEPPSKNTSIKRKQHLKEMVLCG